jgi:hypothetical protein
MSNEHDLAFMTDHAENGFRRSPNKTQVTRLRLPQKLRSRILEEALCWRRVTEIDLDTDTCFPYETALIN